ncbi:MAG: nucleotidyltransferase family protein [Acidobacteriota bacterium]
MTDTVLTDAIRWGLLQRRAQEHRASQAFELFRRQGIEPILIKGLAAAWYYPESHPRLSVDMDLAVSTDDYEKAKEIARASTADGLAIDLHRELRHLDTVEWEDLVANSQLLDVGSNDIRVLRAEDHLRVLCVHWLTDGGSNKDRLWDIFYILDNRHEDFDWKRFLDTVSIRRRRWLICTVGLAGRFLGLDLWGTPLENAARGLPPWLVKMVEKEWSSDVPLRPLSTCLHDPVQLVKQIKKRLPPNPIQATLDMEGSFDAKTRMFYQIASIFKRARSVSRISRPTD